MLGNSARDARRTERYLDGLMAADERRAAEVPTDVDIDPAVRLAARELRAGLTRVHPSFRFEESLAARLAAGAARLQAGLSVEEAPAPVTPGTVAPFRSRSPGAVDATLAAADLEAAQPEPAAVAAAGEPAPAPSGQSPAIWTVAAFRRFPEMAARPSRPLIVGGVGVGVASAAIGAVYVAWRHSHPASGRMGRAVRAAHGRATRASRGRQTGVIDGILGVVS